MNAGDGSGSRWPPRPTGPPPNCNCNPPVPAKCLETRKEGNNKGRFFYTCSASRNGCFFAWADQVNRPSAPRGPGPSAASPPRGPTQTQAATTPQRSGAGAGAGAGGGAGGLRATLGVADDGLLTLSNPFDDAIRKLHVGLPGRQWVPESKSWRFDPSCAAELEQRLSELPHVVLSVSSAYQRLAGFGTGSPCPSVPIRPLSDPHPPAVAPSSSVASPPPPYLGPPVTASISVLSPTCITLSNAYSEALNDIHRGLPGRAWAPAPAKHFVFDATAYPALVDRLTASTRPPVVLSLPPPEMLSILQPVIHTEEAADADVARYGEEISAACTEIRGAQMRSFFAVAAKVLLRECGKRAGMLWERFRDVLAADCYGDGAGDTSQQQAEAHAAALAEIGACLAAEGLSLADCGLPQVVVTATGHQAPEASTSQAARTRPGPGYDRFPLPTLEEMAEARARVPATLWETLFPYQRQGVESGLKFGGRILIGDDMGLGKTIQAIALASAYEPDWPILVVCPSSVRGAWEEAFTQWLPDITVRVVVNGKDAARPPRAGSARATVVSYTLLDKVAEASSYGVVIADESHYLKAATSLRTKTACRLLRAAPRAILLSGTPALNRPMELFEQINALRPGLFTREAFGDRYCDPKPSRFGDAGRMAYLGASNSGELQRLLESKIMIRRKKNDVLEQLPAKMRKRVTLTLAAKDLAHAAAVEKQLDALGPASTPEDDAEKKALMGRWYVATGEAKVKAVCEYVAETLIEGGGVKALIFAYHKLMMDGLESLVKKHKVGYVRIDGKTAAMERPECARRFQNDPSCTIALLSIHAAGEGLTLTAASTVLFAELVWTPGKLIQAEDRAHRIGQKNAVNVVYLIAKGTMDEILWKTITKKLHVVGQAVDASGKAAHLNDALLESAILRGSGQQTLSAAYARATQPGGSLAPAGAEAAGCCEEDDAEALDDVFTEMRASQGGAGAAEGGTGRRKRAAAPAKSSDAETDDEEEEPEDDGGGCMKKARTRVTDDDDD